MPRTSLGDKYWRTRLRSWSPANGDLQPGYTLLLPVPGDLPVFLELALAAAASQDSAHRRATMVIPDRPTPEITSIVESYRKDWNDELSVTLLPSPERWFLPIMKSGSRNHGMQLIAGVTQCKTTHILLHDADLFPCNTDLLEQQYLRCVERDLSCFGVSGVWDGWYETHGLKLAATWELVARVEWLRSFTPYQHIGHPDELFDESHVFDTTLFPQAVTDPNKVDHAGLSDEFVHFNYVITAYRFFQRHGPGYLDDRFLMLFISLMTDLLGAGKYGSALPVPEKMVEALHASSPAIQFPAPAIATETYERFRLKLGQVLVAPWLPAASVTRIQPIIEEFDRHYGFVTAR